MCPELDRILGVTNSQNEEGNVEEEFEPCEKLVCDQCYTN
jgi:hypothetical protein